MLRSFPRPPLPCAAASHLAHVPTSASRSLPWTCRWQIAQEIKLLAHLSHPNIIKFKDNFVDNGIMHILMEYASGGTLHRKIEAREGELFPEDAIWEMFVQIVAALRYVHSCNVLHRDLKTQNIMLSGPSGRTVKLGDFGIAKVLGSAADMAATIVGTP
jgi:NIMA (never in mitosis gene a)-related kinase